MTDVGHVPGAHALTIGRQPAEMTMADHDLEAHADPTKSLISGTTTASDHFDLDPEAVITEDEATNVFANHPFVRKSTFLSRNGEELLEAEADLLTTTSSARNPTKRPRNPRRRSAARQNHPVQIADQKSRRRRRAKNRKNLKKILAATTARPQTETIRCAMVRRVTFAMMFVYE